MRFCIGHSHYFCCAASSPERGMPRGGAHPMAPSTNMPQQPPMHRKLYNSKLPAPGWPGRSRSTPPRGAGTGLWPYPSAPGERGAMVRHLSSQGATQLEPPPPGHCAAGLPHAASRPVIQQMQRQGSTAVNPARTANRDAVKEGGAGVRPAALAPMPKSSSCSATSQDAGAAAFFFAFVCARDSRPVMGGQ